VDRGEKAIVADRISETMHQRDNNDTIKRGSGHSGAFAAFTTSRKFSGMTNG
jgi:hypothetical protein